MSVTTWKSASTGTCRLLGWSPQGATPEIARLRLAGPAAGNQLAVIASAATQSRTPRALRYPWQTLRSALDPQWHVGMLIRDSQSIGARPGPGQPEIPGWPPSSALGEGHQDIAVPGAVEAQGFIQRQVPGAHIEAGGVYPQQQPGQGRSGGAVAPLHHHRRAA